MPRNGFLHQELAEGHDDKELSYVQVSQGRGLGLCGFSYMWYPLPKSLPQGVAGTSCGSSWIGSGPGWGNALGTWGVGLVLLIATYWIHYLARTFRLLSLYSGAAQVQQGGSSATWLARQRRDLERSEEGVEKAEGVSKVDGKKMEEGRIWRLVRRREKMRKQNQ